MIRVTVWGENLHEQRDELVQKLYPQGMHGAIADGISEYLGEEAKVRTVTLEQPEHGLTEQVLAESDVLTWWGHIGHDHVADEIVERVKQRVLQGMGLVVLHSGHFSKIFRSLMGTSCSLRWRSIGERELVWNVSPGHRIAEGIPPVFGIEAQEMYGEFFDIPQPDELVFISASPAARSFVPGAASTEAPGASSTSAPVTRITPSTTTL